MPIIMRMVLVLPAPLGPSKPKMCAGGIENEIPSTAANPPYDFRTSSSSTDGVTTR
ncbi:MAG: hypothetical protein WA642_19485 [Steroidobacteraceae bacterium]